MENLPKEDNQKELDKEYRSTVDIFRPKDIVTPTCLGLQKANAIIVGVRHFPA